MTTTKGYQKAAKEQKAPSVKSTFRQSRFCELVTISLLSRLKRDCDHLCSKLVDHKVCEAARKEIPKLHSVCTVFRNTSTYFST